MAALYVPVPATLTEKDRVTPPWLLYFQGVVRALQQIVAGVVTPEVTFAELPALPIAGQIGNISDGDTAVWGATVGGGGVNHVAVRWNGSDWTVTGA